MKGSNWVIIIIIIVIIIIGWMIFSGDSATAPTDGNADDSAMVDDSGNVEGVQTTAGDASMDVTTDDGAMATDDSAVTGDASAEVDAGATVDTTTN